MSFDHKKWENQLRSRRHRQFLFKWAAENANCTPDDIEFCDHGDGLRIKSGRVIARRNLDNSTGVDWFMVGCAGSPSDLVF